jgi:hypothetical protein
MVFLALVLLIPFAGLRAQSRMAKPNDVNFELGGRCLIYSLNYQRMIAPAFGLEVGASMIGGATSGSGASVFFLSGGGRLYFIDKPASPFIAGGLVFASAGTNAGPGDISGSTVYFYVSPGFEYRMTGGFLFRAGVNFLIKHGFYTWPGIQLGICF